MFVGVTSISSATAIAVLLPSVLWRCWLGGRKGILPVKNWWGAGMVICLERGADLHMAQLMPLPVTVSCFSKIQIGFTFLVPAHLGSPGKGSLNGCVLLLALIACVNTKDARLDPAHSYASLYTYLVTCKPQLFGISAVLSPFIRLILLFPATP